MQPSSFAERIFLLHKLVNQCPGGNGERQKVEKAADVFQEEYLVFRGWFWCVPAQVRADDLLGAQVIPRLLGELLFPFSTEVLYKASALEE